MRNLIVTAVAVIGLAGPATAENWAVALPSAHPEGQAALEQPMWEVFADLVGPGDTYRVLNATEPGLVAGIAVPNDSAFDRKKRRARHFKAENARIHAHLKSITSGNASVDLTGLLRHVVVNRVDRSAPLALLVIGDALQVFEGDPSFSMRDGDGSFQVPSDGHLPVSLTTSPWGARSPSRDGLDNVSVHICHSGAAMVLNDAEEEALRRFWALYIQIRGGMLASWGQDLPTCFERFAARGTRPIVVDTPNQHDRLLVMRKIGRSTIETIEGTGPNAKGGTVINGVAVDNFSLFADKPHPTLSGIKVVTGVRYKPSDYPNRYEAAWCYFSIRKNGTLFKFDLGTKSPGSAPSLITSAGFARRAAGIDLADFEAGQRVCQWPTL